MSDITTLIKTAHFAAQKHKNQRRKDVSATPYINHPLGVTDYLASLGGITDIITLQVRIIDVHFFAL